MILPGYPASVPPPAEPETIIQDLDITPGKSPSFSPEIIYQFVEIPATMNISVYFN